MLLESESLRKIFEKGDQSFYQKSLEVIHQEIKKICPYQIKFDEPEYVNIHLSLIKTFLLLHRSPRQMAAERLSSVIKDMFSGKKSNLPKGNENSSEE